MSVKHNLEQWISELDSDGMCDISDNQVIAMIRGYAALEAKCAALAAENSALSKFIDDECYVYGPHDVEPVDAALEKPETPVTDAFLAEVRASGVEMFASHLRTNDNGASVCKMIALGADEFAAQLRQEAK